MSSEKRLDERKPVVWHATLTLDDDSVIECEVRDVAYAGTLVTCEQDLNLEDEVLLSIDGLGDFAGIVKWKKGIEKGLILLGGPDLLLKKFADAHDEEISHHPQKTED